MATVKRFEDLEMWKLAIVLARRMFDVYGLTDMVGAK
jgi:hypothetical protein